MIIFSSKREFRLFSYQIGHGMLLFRSGKDEVHASRLSVLIKDVRVMEMRCSTRELVIEEVSPETLGIRLTQPEQTLEIGLKCYLLRGIGWEGYLVADAVLIAEDDREYMDPVDKYW